jgi:hypothetical protein
MICLTASKFEKQRSVITLRFYPYFFGFPSARFVPPPFVLHGFPPARSSFSAVPSARFYTSQSSLRLFNAGSSSLFIPLVTRLQRPVLLFGSGLQSMLGDSWKVLKKECPFRIKPRRALSRGLRRRPHCRRHGGHRPLVRPMERRWPDRRDHDSRREH